jgi:hypothetical protein
MSMASTGIEERPIPPPPSSAGKPPPSIERVPPTGPKSTLPPGSPPIPTAPRAQLAAEKGQGQLGRMPVSQQRPHNQGIARSSKQWVNPAIASPSPKAQRSLSFISHQGKPQLAYRPQSSHSDHHPDPERRGSHADQHGDPDRQRPRSSDGHPERPIPSQDYHQGKRPAAPVRMTGPNAVPLPKRERNTPSARASMDRDAKVGSASNEYRMNPPDNKSVPEHKPRDDSRAPIGRGKDGLPSPASPYAKPPVERPFKVSRPRWKKSRIRVPAATITYQAKAAKLSPPTDDASDSEDEGMEHYFDKEIAQKQAEVNKFIGADDLDIEHPLRYTSLACQAGIQAALLQEGTQDADKPRSAKLQNGVSVKDMAEELPAVAATAEASSSSKEQMASEQNDQNNVSEPPTPGLMGSRQPAPEQAGDTKEKDAAAPSIAEPEAVKAPTADESVLETANMNIDQPEESSAPEPQPKVEEADTETSGLHPSIPAPTPPVAEEVDEDMLDAVGEDDDTLLPPPLPVMNGNGIPSIEGSRLSPYPADEEQLASRRTSQRTTPEQAEEDDDDTEIEEVDHATLGDFRRYMPTPPLDELPDLALPPWQHSKAVRKAGQMPEALAEYILARMTDEHVVSMTEQANKKADYREKYEQYLRFTLSNDPVAVKSRNYLSNGTTTQASGKAAASAEDKREGGRRAPTRFATELDLNLVIQQSIKEEKERKEREERARQEKYRSEKEAVIPDMYWHEEDRERVFYLDRSGYLPVEKLIDAWQVLPPINNFTDEEKALFEKAYLDFPKQWGKIAEEIPNRDFRACIQYYYSAKKELNLKAKLKKQPKKRKPKGRKQKAASELGNPENETEAPEETIGENGERRRPRRAAAPTWGYEQTPAVDSDGNTPAATPARGRKNDSGADKPEAKKRKPRGPAKDKGDKAAKAAQQVLAPTPAPGSKPNRSRSNSRVQNPAEWVQPQQVGPNDMGRLPTHFEMAPAGMQPPIPLPVQQPALASPERMPMALNTTISEVMAPPSLRPEPPPPPANMPTFDSFPMGPTGGDRRSQLQPSSYWSVSETTDFPNLLRSFGTDWQAIAHHMKTKTMVMVSFR